MNLNQLRFAHAVATTASFTAASAKCCVTQPTLSNGIAQLESELGERLFVRTTRKVALTTFGENILPYITEVLHAQINLVQQTKVLLNPEKRLIRIGTSPLVSAHLLRLMVEPFQRGNHEVDIVLREMNMDDLYRTLDAGLLDFVFGVANLHKGSWSSAFLYEEPLQYIPCGGPHADSPARASVQIKDIAGETYVMVPDACGLARTTRALFRSQRRKLHEYSGEAMSYQVLQDWAALGIGAAILPKSKVSATGRLSSVITDKQGNTIMIKFEAIWLPTSTQASHLREFSDHLLTIVPAIVGGLESGAKHTRR